MPTLAAPPLDTFTKTVVFASIKLADLADSAHLFPNVPPFAVCVFKALAEEAIKPGRGNVLSSTQLADQLQNNNDKVNQTLNLLVGLLAYHCPEFRLTIERVPGAAFSPTRRTKIPGYRIISL